MIGAADVGSQVCGASVATLVDARVRAGAADVCRAGRAILVDDRARAAAVAAQVCVRIAAGGW